MPKTRMTALDVRACVNELKGIVLGAKLANVYDVSNKVYILKLMKGGAQYNLVIESGVRVHLTKYLREKNQFPNTFSQKLRKHIRNRRIEAVRQIGFDRVVDLVFGNGETTYHVIVELYSGGNIILTNYEFEVMFLLRSYTLNDGTQVDVKHQYNFHPKQHSPFDAIQSLTVSSLKDSISVLLSRWSELKSKEKQAKSVLCANHLIALLGPLFAAKCLRLVNVDPASTTENEAFFANETDLARLLAVIQSEARSLEQSIESPRGYILCEGDPVPATETTPAYEPFVEFGPFEVPLAGGESSREFSSFNECIDAYFVNEENLRVAAKLQKSREAINKRVETISAKQSARIRALESEIAACRRRIRALQSYPTVVNTAIVVLNQYLSQGVQWSVLQEQVKLLKQRPYNVFHHIKQLDLEHNRVKLEFDDDFDDDDDDDDDDNDNLEDEDDNDNLEDDDDNLEGEAKMAATSSRSESPHKINVDVELSLNCNQNISLLFSQKKDLQDKLDKTVQAAQAAVAEASKQRQTELRVAEAAHPAEIARQREKRWFEKFDWCVTTDGFIVLAGKSGEQNEILVRRYLRPGDLFLHADVHGAATVVLRNYRAPELPGEAALLQAAAFALCHSSAWDAQLLCKVYWVPARQVSKTAPSGEYLPTGSFMIRGKKNFLAPYRMEMGLTVLFEVRPEDVQRHFYDRKPREMEDADWETLVKHGVPRVDTAESANDPEVFDEDAEDYVIEVMDSVSAPKTAGKAVVRGRVDVKNSKNSKNAKNSKNSKSEEAKGGKKSLKGTTKKSRALAEEQAEMEALIAEQTEEPRKKEMSRGEKRKMKKMKKHAAVDDEERRLMDVLYGHTTVETLLAEDAKKTAEKKSGNETAIHRGNQNETPINHENGNETPSLLNETPSLLNETPASTEAAAILQDLMGLSLAAEPAAAPALRCFTCGSSEHDQRNCPESWRVIAGIEGVLEDQPETAKDADETGETGETGETEEATRDTADFLLNWTFRSVEGDGILHAVPMCAPYSAIVESPYRAKLTPGKMKKGAMAKSVLEGWIKSATNEMEKKALKQIPMQDLISVIINNSRVAVSGAKGKKCSVC